MLKIEYVWRELLYQAVEKKQPDFTITQLGKKFHLSTSVISHALKPLRDLGIVEIGKIKSRTINAEKLLYFWATRRNLKKDIIYQTFSPLSVLERETSMPPDVTPTAYSAFRFYLPDPPADYDSIYFYSFNLSGIEKRFPLMTRRPANLFILKPDPFLKSYRQIPLAQIFADLWNLPEWYAKDFNDALLLKIEVKIFQSSEKPAL